MKDNHYTVKIGCNHSEHTEVDRAFHSTCSWDRYGFGISMSSQRDVVVHYHTVQHYPVLAVAIAFVSHSNPETYCDLSCLSFWSGLWRNSCSTRLYCNTCYRLYPPAAQVRHSICGYLLRSNLLHRWSNFPLFARTSLNFRWRHRLAGILWQLFRARECRLVLRSLLWDRCDLEDDRQVGSNCSQPVVRQTSSPGIAYRTNADRAAILVHSEARGTRSIRCVFETSAGWVSSVVRAAPFISLYQYSYVTDTTGTRNLSTQNIRFTMESSI